MGRIALLWLLLTPVWIAFSLSASASKIAFIPPALVVVALVFYWLHNRFVILVAGEHEPRADFQLSQSQLSQSELSQSELSQTQLSQSSHFQPVATASLVRPAFIAIGVGICAGAAAASIVLFERPLHEVSARRAAADAIQPSAAVDAEPKAVKPQSFSTEQTTQNTSRVTSPNNSDTKQAEAQIQAPGRSSTDQPRCNVSLCENSYQSFRASDCTYQPHSGPRQYCAR